MAKTNTNFGEKVDVDPDAHLAKEAAGGDPIAYFRWWATAGLLAAGTLFLAAGTSWPGHTVHTPGLLSNPHAVWDARCAACHPTFTPISAHDWAGQLMGMTHAADANCQSCHRMPTHHHRAKAGDEPACAACHQEHRGRDASLRRAADAQCLGCHSDLKSHTIDGQTAVLNLTGVADHPDFKGLRDKGTHPSRLKFNHAWHMTEGMKRAADSTTLIKDGDGRPGQLRCAHCHEADALVNGDGPGPARSPGDSMLPVSFEKHCRNCHPQTFNNVEVPHGIQPAGVREHLEAHFTSRLLGRGLPWLDRPRLRPGERPGEERDRATFRRELEGNVLAVERMAHLDAKGCALCHHYDTLPATVPPAARPTLKIDPPAVPDVWLASGRFSHAKHAQLACRECHPQADPRLGKPPPEWKADDPKKERDPPMLPTMDTCRRCHSPAAGPEKGGVRHACVDCHAYHNADHPLQGRGAAARRAGEGVGVDAFFKPRR